MGSPAISIIIPTCRTGWLTDFIASLQAQTFRDFEVVVVDETGEIEEPDDLFVNTSPFDVRVLPPSHEFEYFRVASLCNDGMRAARGELFVWVGDFTRIPDTDKGKRWLEEHWEWYRTNGGRKLLMHGTYRRVSREGKVTYEDNRHQYCRASPDGLILPPQMAWLSNCGVPRRPFDLGVTMDAEYDGARGFHDIDYAMRLVKLGYTFIYRPDSMIEELDHHSFYTDTKPSLFPESQNKARFEERWGHP